MPSYLAAVAKLHPDVLNDFGAPRVRLFPVDGIPRVIAVVYANGLHAYSWKDETLTQASDEDFVEMVRSLPKSWPRSGSSACNGQKSRLAGTSRSSGNK